MEFDIEFTDFLLKGTAALVAGFCMGLERQMKGKHAGLKTNVLVALGAAIFMMISLIFADSSTTDLTRVLGQIVVGVGFLGAGVILRTSDKKRVKGLATAATIWCSAAAGCLAGLGIYDILGGFTVFVVLVNIIFGYLNKKVSENNANLKD
ncbi:MgtC/SapB family protein [Marixanthomonas spongiae]|uniref:Magnesium transporter MgtC n=1 Tax=Marixanthomonas spongiae TaxID=2174845 RepID=A0A2U0I567_9FLAO|nr:MgtC/SapB family protein [Marixanthomonas spongiae]PVW16253.1 magnesium transporter MgtC [Marixanthomonas spongiae]